VAGASYIVLWAVGSLIGVSGYAANVQLRALSLSRQRSIIRHLVLVVCVYDLLFSRLLVLRCRFSSLNREFHSSLDWGLWMVF